MAKSIFRNVSIKGMAVVLGENKISIDTEPQYYNNDMDQLLRLKKTIGFNERYWANKNTTTCDLCESAAKKLLKKLDISPGSLDGIIFVTQTPDYYMPGNAHIIHKNLGCNNNTIAMDLEFGCSGYIYGLWTAFMMINSGLKKFFY